MHISVHKFEIISLQETFLNMETSSNYDNLEIS